MELYHVMELDGTWRYSVQQDFTAAENDVCGCALCVRRKSTCWRSTHMQGVYTSGYSCLSMTYTLTNHQTF